MTVTLSYLVSILLVTQEPDGLVANLLTFFPPSAPMVVPLRAALDAIPAWQVIVSILLMLVAIWVLFVVGGRVYSGAVLQTGARVKLREAWRSSGGS
jgi:ABC-2 type transport system permease protein